MSDLTSPDAGALIAGAAEFAIKAHGTTMRKDGTTPQFLHSAEAASIAAGITSDPCVISATFLHDVVEDTSVTENDLRSEFGDRITDLVMSETEKPYEGVSREASWETRKAESVASLKATGDIGVKVMWLSDKLSNIRSIYRSYCSVGDDVWLRFHQRDKKKHEKYYRDIADALSELSDTCAYREYCELLNKLFCQE